MELPSSGGGSLVITGPAGSGKSVLALQSVLGRFDSCQYISVRELPVSLLPSTGPSNEFGTAMANIANHLMNSPGSDALDLQRLGFDRINQLDSDSPGVVVFDDVDVLTDKLSPERMRAAAHVFSQLRNSFVVWITRTGLAPISGFMNAQSRPRVILPSLLSITQEELPGFMRAGSFGNYEQDSIHESYDSMGGWFAGIRRMLDAQTFGDSVLDDYVFNELVLRSPVSLQAILGVLIEIPFVTHELLEYLFAGLDADPLAVTTTLCRLPLVTKGQTLAGATKYRLPDSLKISLARVLPQLGGTAESKALTVRALNWLLSTEDPEIIEAPILLHGNAAVFVESARKECASLAAEERWPQIQAILSRLPESMVFGDSDLAFWYMKGCSYLGDWEMVTKIRHAVLESWSGSADPLERGRMLLIESWRNWTQSNPETALEKASSAYHALPESRFQDRLWAAIQAENAARNIGVANDIEIWSAITGGFGTRMTTSPEFWHINCGFHRLNHLALSGKLEHAQRLAYDSMLQAPPVFPHARVRYLLLRGYIEIERGNHQLAQFHLEAAQHLASTQPIKAQVSLANAAYLLATGKTDEARKILEPDVEGISTRPDFHLARVRFLAEAYLAMGEARYAQNAITSLVGGHEQWPKYFGEPHPHLLSARILLELGSVNSAFETAQFVINEATKRGHNFFLIQANAIQAECLHQRGRNARRDDKIAAALNADNHEGAARALSPFGHAVHTLSPLFTPGKDGRPRTSVRSLISKSELTPREMEILDAVAAGQTTREIAEQLYISQNTVKNHLASTFRKLRVNSRKEAIAVVFPLNSSRSEAT